MRPWAAAGVRPNPPALDPRRPGRPNGIAEVVRRCPTGALHYRLWAGDPEEPARPTTITRDPAGPLLVRGDLHLDTPDGARDETRAALCGCGQTSTQPFCDGACGVNQQHPGGTRDPAPASGKEP
jgi:Iron-binding zinc finger CDGSH type